MWTFSRKAFFEFLAQFFGISCFLPKKWRKIEKSLKLPPFWAKKWGKTQNIKNPYWQKFYLLGNFIFPNFGVNMTIFEEEDRFFVIFWFFGKNRNFFRFWPPTGPKKTFWRKKFLFLQILMIDILDKQNLKIIQHKIAILWIFKVLTWTQILSPRRQFSPMF